MNKKERLSHELLEHIPFTLTATAFAIVLAFVFSYLKLFNNEGSFEILHPLHVFVSVIVSSALYYKYSRGFFGSLFIGVLSSVIIGSLSDIIFPFLGALVFGLNPSFHLPIFEEPFLILGVALIGSLIGIFTGFTKIPHFLHIFISVFASLFYLLAFSSISFDILGIVIMLIITFVAVLVPCCLSDIVIPVFFSGLRHEHGHEHSHKCADCCEY